MRIKIQPTEVNGTSPYPYFISEDGAVGRQDFWKGRPAKLIGFSSKFKTGELDLMWREFWADPKKAIGKFPVFADTNDNWYTADQIIDDVKVLEDA